MITRERPGRFTTSEETWFVVLPLPTGCVGSLADRALLLPYPELCFDRSCHRSRSTCRGERRRHRCCFRTWSTLPSPFPKTGQRKTGNLIALFSLVFSQINVEIAHLRRPPTKTYSLARERYIEMHEQSWCPPGIREAVQRSKRVSSPLTAAVSADALIPSFVAAVLMMMWTTRMWPIQQRAPVDCVVEVLEEVIGELEGGKGDKAEELTVVDFCSGDGGVSILSSFPPTSPSTVEQAN
jgi:hypothetical protein